MKTDDENGESSLHIQSATDEELSELFSDPYTRYLMAHLRDSNEPIELGQLSKRVAASITEQSVEDVQSETIRQIETFLHHGQLPALSRHGLLEYDPDDGIVELTDDTE